MTDSYHDVVLRPGDGGQHVDAVSREVSSLLGLVVDAVRPARVHHMFSVMFIQDDQIPLTETQEGGVNASCRTEVTARVAAQFRTAEPSPQTDPEAHQGLDSPAVPPRIWTSSSDLRGR